MSKREGYSIGEFSREQAWLNEAMEYYDSKWFPFNEVRPHLKIQRKQS